MRGKAVPRRTLLLRSGITPAYAGKRYSKVSHSIPSWDHPRLCGEKLSDRKDAAEEEGSPPPMRGKAFGYLVAAIGIRITPAYAGKRMCNARLLKPE